MLPAHRDSSNGRGPAAIIRAAGPFIQHSPFVVDEDDRRQWAGQHAAQNLSMADIQDFLPELKRRRQVLTGERVAHWVWGPLSQRVTMGQSQSS